MKSNTLLLIVLAIGGAIVALNWQKLKGVVTGTAAKPAPATPSQTANYLAAANAGVQFLGGLFGTGGSPYTQTDAGWNDFWYQQGQLDAQESANPQGLDPMTGARLMQLNSQPTPLVWVSDVPWTPTPATLPLTDEADNVLTDENGNPLTG